MFYIEKKGKQARQNKRYKEEDKEEKGYKVILEDGQEDVLDMDRVRQNGEERHVKD